MINDAIGKIVKSYQLVDLIGTGGFGAVYRAKQALVEREVAIKVIWPSFANHPTFIRRFEAEAQLVAGLEHPHIVPLYDYWRDPEGAYIVMRYLRGGALTNLMQGRQWTLPEVNRVLSQLTGALALAHRFGVVHRDIKPENILLDEDNNAYLADFGIAQIISKNDEMMGMGSPAYAAPEQVVGGITSSQSDIYSMGVILYELLTGQHPFPELEDLSMTEMNELRANAKLPSIMDKRSDLSRSINDVLQRATALDPKYRFADAQSLARAFQDASGSAGRSYNGHRLTYPMLLIPNPYKGLRAFQESDSQNFFGREALIQRLINRMREDGEYSRFLAIVGPSGSGKSSVVRAGLIPALREGALHGSEEWYYDQVILGADPYSEIENLIVGLAVNPPERLRERLTASEDGLLNAINEVLPDGAELLLFIDQFEEVFTLSSEENQFLQSLYVAVTHPKSRIRLIITIRADFYDRPLLQPRLSDLMRERTEVVVPLSPSEIERAILEPARRVGVMIDHGLTAAIVNEVKEQPSSLPLLQYTLSEMFEKRDGSMISPEVYKELGGVRGALTKRADEIYSKLNEDEREAMRQLFLRLITLGEGTEDTRRRALLSEVTSLRDKDEQSLVMRQVIDKLGKARLVSFDRDPISRSPTIEVTHEAIIREWNMLRSWLDDSRHDMRMQRSLANLAAEWDENGREYSFLMRGGRLESYEKWAEQSHLAFTEQENAFLLASMAARNLAKEEEGERKARERLLVRQNLNRARYLAIVLAIATVIGFALSSFAFFQSNRAGDEARRAEDALELSQSSAWEASAREALSADDDLAILLAMQAVSIENPPSQALNTLSEVAFSAGSRAIFLGHRARVQDVAISPDSRWIASASTDSTVIVWDASTGEMRYRLLGHGGDVDSVVFSPDGRYLLSAAADFKAILWDIETGQEVRRFVTPAQPMRDAEFSPDGSQILSASNNGLVILWDVATGQELRRFEGHGLATVLTVAFSPDGLHAFSGARDGRLFYWDIATGESIVMLGHNTQINDVEFSEDGRFAASASGDGMILLWDVASHSLIRQLLGSNQEIRDISFSHDGRLLYAASLNGAVLVFDVEAGLVVDALYGHTAAVTNIAVSNDGQLMVTGSEDTSLRLWNIGLPAVESFLIGHERRVQDVAYHENKIYSVSVDGSLIIWENAQFSQTYTFPETLSSISLYQGMALIGSRSGAYLLNLSTGEQRLLSGQSGRVNDVILLGNRALGATSDNEVVLWDTESGEILRRFPHNDAVNAIALMPNGEQFLAAASDGSLSLWNIATGVSLRSFDGYTEGLSSVAIHGNIAATGTRDGFVMLWDIARGSEISRIVVGDTAVWSVAFNTAGDRLAIGAGDGIVMLWDMGNNSAIAHYDAGSSSVFSVAFTNDGLISAQDDASVLLWRLYDRDELLNWVQANRHLRAWRCIEIEQYHLPEGTACEG